MRIEVDTSHDSHDDIKKVIRMLQHLVGESQEIFTNNPQEAASPMANIFGDVSTQPQSTSETTIETAQAQETSQEAAEETSQSTEDLFAELFSEEELKKMDVQKEEEPEIKPKSKEKKFGIEFY